MIWTGTRGRGGNIAQTVCAIYNTCPCVVGIPIQSPVSGGIVTGCKVSSLKKPKLVVGFVSEKLMPYNPGGW